MKNLKKDTEFNLGNTLFIADVNENTNLIKFVGKDGKDMMSIETNGDIYIKGELATTNKQIVDGMKMFINGNTQEVLSQRLIMANELLAVQGQEGNWSYNEYMSGMYNGMELIVACMEDRDPIYKKYKDSGSKLDG